MEDVEEAHKDLGKSKTKLSKPVTGQYDARRRYLEASSTKTKTTLRHATEPPRRRSSCSVARSHRIAVAHTPADRQACRRRTTTAKPPICLTVPDLVVAAVASQRPRKSISFAI